MIQNRYYRKHPRSHAKSNNKEKENDDNILSLSAPMTAGILAFSFINGMLLGYMWKKCRC